VYFASTDSCERLIAEVCSFIKNEEKNELISWIFMCLIACVSHFITSAYIAFWVHPRMPFKYHSKYTWRTVAVVSGWWWFILSSWCVFISTTNSLSVCCLEVHLRFHTGWSWDHILSWTRPVHIFTPYLKCILIISPLRLGFPSGLLVWGIQLGVSYHLSLRLCVLHVLPSCIS